MTQHLSLYRLQTLGGEAVIRDIEEAQHLRQCQP
jgi:hypothetical protein